MVASRGRVVALTFVVLLMLSAFAPIFPVASAQTGHVTKLKINVGGTYVDYVPATHGVVQPGDELAVEIYATVGRCQPTVPGSVPSQRPATLTANLDVDGKLVGGTADLTQALTFRTEDVDEISHFFGNLTFTVAPNLAPGLESANNVFGLTFTATCPQTTPPLDQIPTVAATATSPAVTVDTLAPRMPAGPSSVWTNASTRIAGGTADVAAIGHTIAVTPTITEANLKNVSYDFSKFGWGTGPQDVVGSTVTAQAFVVNESTVSGKVLDAGGRVPFWINASDIYGNSIVAPAAISDPWSIKVDNVRPAIAPVLGPGNLTRTAAGATVDIRWTGDASLGFVQASYNTTSATQTLLGVITRTDGRGIFPVSIPTPLTTPLQVTLAPVDLAGNLATDPALARTTQFPTGISVEFGGNPGIPLAVTGSTVRNVYVNVTGYAPTLPYASGEDLRVFGELKRTNTGAFWKNNTQGSNSGTDAATSGHHFQLTENLAPSDVTQDTNGLATVFQPAPASTGTGAYVLTNLSSRSFVDGSYELWINVSSPSGHRTKIVHPFLIDSFNPNVAAHRNFTTTPIASGPNMTDLHGMDGNPIRAVINVTEWNSDANGRHASGLRNVTLELFDPATGQVVPRTGGGLAQINVAPGRCDADLNLTVTGDVAGPLPYCSEVAPVAPSPSTCPAYTGTAPAPRNDPSNDLSNPDCAYKVFVERVAWLNGTYMNNTAFMGWFNASWPDLPTGKWRLRVLSYDNASRETVTVSSGTADTDHYRVGPVAAIEGEPRIGADGKLSVVALASHRYASVPLGLVEDCGTGATGQAPTSVCPVSRVRIYLSNDIAASDWGFDTGIALQPSSVTEPANKTTLNVLMPASTYNTDGALGYGGLDHWGFPYRFNGLDIPTNVNLSKPVYARAVAIVLNSTGDQVVNSTSAWVKVASSITPSLTISEPSTDWQHNLTTEFDNLGTTTTIHAGPSFNVSFDRKTVADAPLMNYTIYNITSEAPWTEVVVASNVTHLAPIRNLNGALPQYHFNWTGRFTKDDGSPLGSGAFRVHVNITGGVGQAPIAEADRYFSILQQRPNVTVDKTRLVGAAQKTGSNDYFVGNDFEVPFVVNHGYANLTSPDQITVKLVRGIVRAGQAGELKRGDDGFDYTIAAETLDTSFNSSSFTLRVKMPTGITNGDPFDLNITALLDVAPHRMGNATNLLSLRLDKQPASGGLLVPETELTVFNGSAGPPATSTAPRDKDLSPSLAHRIAPAFVGSAQDTGAGVAAIEVRIFDATANQTIRLNTDGEPFTIVPGNNTAAVNWMSSVTMPNIVKILSGPDANGLLVWSVPLTGRLNSTGASALPDVWKSNDTGLINLSHKYVVDVRVTDKLAANPAGESTKVVDFDAAPPFLGYGTRLNVPSTTRSGINSTVTRVDWHGSAILKVNVSDNQCLKSVRLVGFSELRPNVTVKAEMSPVTARDSRGLICYETSMPHSTTASGNVPALKYSQWQLDLASAPLLTDDVANYTYWYEAEDLAGQISEVPTNFRTFKMQVIDNTAATVRSALADPAPGQAGGRSIIRADIFDNLLVSHVTVEVRDANTNALLTNGTMRPTANATASPTKSGLYEADTTDDLNLTLEVRDYLVIVTAYDVNWNRTGAAGNPTCSNSVCVGQPFIFRVRDDGAPSVQMVSPVGGSTVNGTPTFTMRALNKNLQRTDIIVRAGTEGNATIVPTANLTFTELTGANSTRQGWTVVFAPGALPDAQNYTVNISASVGGAIAAQTFTFRVDSLPPTVTANVTGTEERAGKVWAVAATRVALTAQDNVSATSILYTVNGAASPTTYTGSITPSGDSGEWKLEYWAVDAAQNAAPKQTLTLAVDKLGPRISVSQHGDSLLLIANDTGVGLNESSVTVHYRYGEAITFVSKAAEKDTGNLFRALLPGNATETGLAYYFTATDLLGNAGSNFSASAPFVIPKNNGTPLPPANLPPTIQITAPTAGSSVREFLDLKWLAEDPEGAPITITIALRDPAPGSVVSAGGENSGSFRVNMTGRPAGAYTVVITASDGENSASDQVLFNVEAGETIKPRTVPPPTVPARQPVSVAVEIVPTGKEVTQANYRVLKDGQLYTAGRLTGTSGVYAASFTPTEPGSYRVLLDVGYSDGSSDTSKQIATFTVPGGEGPTTAKVLPGSLIALLAIAALTVALAAYGAFGRWKK